MRRNIEVVKDIHSEIEKFRLLSEDIDLMLETEECELTDLFENDDIRLKKVVEVVEKVVDYIKELTEDFKDTLDYSVGDDGGFDCSSLEWCFARVKYDPFEIVNYLEIFENAFISLGNELTVVEKWYKLFTQTSYNTGETEQM